MGILTPVQREVRNETFASVRMFVFRNSGVGFGLAKSLSDIEMYRVLNKPCARATRSLSRHLLETKYPLCFVCGLLDSFN